MRETRSSERPAFLPIVKIGAMPTLVALVLVLLVCSYLIIRDWPQPTVSRAAAGSVQPLQGPGGVQLASFHLPAGYSVIYEQAQGISLLSITNGASHTLKTPGYIYNRAVTPIVTPAHDLIYSGNGIWITSLTSNQSSPLATLPSDQIITSLALSHDGTAIAWSSESRTGNGTVAIYTERLDAPARVARVYQAAGCPCFRVFSFLRAGALLLTNDEGDHRLVQYGLWRFDLPASLGGPIAQPRPLFSSDVQQGPLLFSSQTNTLLYSSYEGFVPTPDNGVPADITSLNYANSLLMASMNQAGESLVGRRIILPEQQVLSGPAAYRWVATPQFSPDERSLAYVEFSSGDRLPFARHYAVYSVSLGRANKADPLLLATASTQYVELGPWLNAAILTFYADNALYALDMQHGAVATLMRTGSYARIISIVK